MDKKNTLKLPKSITILGRKIKIKEGKNLHYNGMPCLGLCDYEGQIIYIEKNQADHTKFDTLCHELSHFFLILCGMDQKMSESEVEMYCQLITAFVNDLLKI